MDEDLSGQIDQIVETRVKAAPLVGVALAVVHDGELITLRSYGQAQLQPEVPVTPDTRFQIASLTKQFTAAATMLAIRDGKIGLDDPLQKWLPETPDSWPTITIRQILGHTSGIPDYTTFDGFLELYKQDLPRAEIETRIFAHELTHAPGTAWAYSNSGYFLLGLVLENAWGLPLEDVLTERIFGPLGMTRTLLMRAGAKPEDLAIGYDVGPEGFVPASYNSPSWSFAAGAILSTARDFARWSAALDTETLLTTEEKQQLWTPTRLADGTATEYGLGWMLKAGPAGRHLVYHRGNKPGFSATIVRLAEDRLSVIVLSNRTEGESSQLANDIGFLFFKKIAG
jgi:CubicO group peptidase (beta-lactamase class C family)